MRTFFVEHDENVEVPIRNVYIELTEDELQEFAEALTHMREAPERGPDSHYHLTTEDMQEVTVWVLGDESS